MQCEQIRKLLDEYATGELPRYKMAWVAQHLAGCPACRDKSSEAHRRATFRAPAEVAATAPPQWAAASLPVQRPVPSWLRRLVMGVVLLLLGGGAWLLLRGTFAVPPLDRPPPGAVPVSAMTGIPAARPESLVAPFTAELRGDVALRVESVTEERGWMHADVRFTGRGLLPPVDPDKWVTVVDAQGHAEAMRADPISVDSRGLSARLHIRLPQGDQPFRLEFGAISQVVHHRYALALPDPTVGLKRMEQELEGLPGGMILERYGIISDVLHVHLRTSGFWPESIPPLYLQDQAGNRIAPAGQDRTVDVGFVTAHFQYALPKQLPQSAKLVGDGYHRKLIGPWRIEGAALSRNQSEQLAGDSLETEE